MTAMVEPVVLRTQRRSLDPASYTYRGAQESDYHTLLTQPTIVFDTEQEKVTIVYLELVDAFEPLVEALRGVHYNANYRVGGMVTRSRSFGYLPRKTIRRDFCTTSALGMDAPETHALVAAYAQRVARYYQQYNPDLYARHQQMVDEVLPDWRMEDSVFTSGIINKDSVLLYHFDAGNLKAVWSNMLVFKQDVAGGYLSVPEYDVGFELKNNSLLMFDGQSLLHGVTPISLLSPDAHRFSIVFYSLQQMWRCLPVGEEIKRIQKIRTEREERRLTRPVYQGESYTKGSSRRKPKGTS